MLVSAQSVRGETGSGGPESPTPQDAGPSGRVPRLWAGWSPPRWALTLLAAGVLVGLVRVFLVQTFVIPSGSMEPGLHVGDRVVVSRLDYRFGQVDHGDVVVFDGEGVFAPPNPPPSALSRLGDSVAHALGTPVGETAYVKRVIGVAGDRVACCDDRGRVTVNGHPLDEPYVYPGDQPSAMTFNQVVPPGRLWVMGDHRSSSADSRDHLGDPGGGMVPVDQVVGRVVAVWWPWNRATGVGRVDPGASTSSLSTPASSSDPPARALRHEVEATP